MILAYIAMRSAHAHQEEATTSRATPAAAFEPDLAQVVAGNSGRLSNCTASLDDVDGKRAVRLDGAPGVGIAWLDGSPFRNGVLELELRGRNVPQKSFVGVAFHGLDDETYDAVYFRPFNFRSDDPVRRSHMVQYVSGPTYVWQKLRDEHPGEYENDVRPVPDPDSWFHARIVVDSPTVSVFVNDAVEPSLVVQQLSDRETGRVGLWVGPESEAEFAGLRITPSG